MGTACGSGTNWPGHAIAFSGRIGVARTSFADLYEPGQSEVEKLRARLQLKNLIHPEGLGEKFQVLIQHKGIQAPRLTGLAGF